MNLPAEMQSPANPFDLSASSDEWHLALERLLERRRRDTLGISESLQVLAESALD